MTGTIVLLAVVLVILLWVITAGRRRALRTYLLAVGAQTTGKATMVRLPRKRHPVISVRYTDNTGTERTVIKSLVSAGDDVLVRKPARVIYHPKRPSRDDYVLLGFGDVPTRWFSARFTATTK